MSKNFGIKYISSFKKTSAQTFNIRTDDAIFASTVSTSGYTGLYKDSNNLDSYPIITTSIDWESSTQGGTPSNSAILMCWPYHVYSVNDLFYCRCFIINVGISVSTTTTALWVSATVLYING